MQEKTQKAIEAAYNQGAHVRDTWVGYHDIRKMRIETDGAGDERERLLCVDGKLISVEKAGWMGVTAMDQYREGVLDLIFMEWEGTELSIGEEQRLVRTVTLSYRIDFPLDQSQRWESPIDEVR